MGNKKFDIRAPLLIAVGLAIGILIGAYLINQSSSNKIIVNSVTKFREIIANIENSYVDEVDSEDLVDNAILDMLDKLDPHSVYIPKRDVEITNADLRGEFEGIGIEFNIIKDTILVVAPLIGGPSEAVGLRSGDKIVKVDGETVAGVGITIRDVVNALRGPKGTEVIVSIRRRNENDLLDFTIIRDKIPQYSIDAGYMINDEIGYIKVIRFASTTYEEFRVKMTELTEAGMKKLILDLQGNPGGYMERAVDIADEFIPGDKLIVSQDGRVKRYNAEFRAYRKGLFEENPVIVLIDEGSASGSEIVAGALQDHDRALIVGRRSFGKGLVQMPIPLSDGSELRLTISRYYTPSGRCIQKPYDEGKDSYHADRINRYENGEYFNADSIDFADTLKYNTAKGRIVYGGGGIMPDHFVPLDTTMNTAYLSHLLYKNAIREYTLNYYNEHREELEAMTLPEFKNDFEVTDSMIKELIRVGESVDVTFNEEEYLTSKPLIINRVKSFIARSVWKNEGWYRIANEYNEIFQEALTQFDEAEHLASATDLRE
ncbi:MAG: S41 family peptidase [Cyclobacteriaceae bacterium]|jgi:carboxyl-terminal processing protease